MNKYVRWVLTGVGGLLLVVALSWGYTNLQLARYSADGVYATPEEGLLALIDRYYPPEREVKMLYAGPNSPDGKRPYIWYAIAEVYASLRADGSAMGNNGCDAPGSYFLQTRDGWVYMPEGAFPTFIGRWMKTFGMAGEGQSTPTTDLIHGPTQFCR